MAISKTELKQRLDDLLDDVNSLTGTGRALFEQQESLQRKVSKLYCAGRDAMILPAWIDAPASEIDAHGLPLVWSKLKHHIDATPELCDQLGTSQADIETAKAWHVLRNFPRRKKLTQKEEDAVFFAIDVPMGARYLASVVRLLIKELHIDEQDSPDYRPASWFKDQFGIPTSRLRTAASRGELPKRGERRRSQYHVPTAQKLWPEDLIYADNPTDA